MSQDPETPAPRRELPMRLTRLRVKNFRSIADIDIPLSPLTVLVGPNGSGKSNVVDALRFVRDVFARGLDQAVMDREGMGVIQRWGTEGDGITIGVTVELTEVEDKKRNRFIISDNKSAAKIEYTFSVYELNDKRVVPKREKIRVDIEGDASFVVNADEENYTLEYGEIVVEYEDKNFDKSYASYIHSVGSHWLFKAAEVLLMESRSKSTNYIRNEKQWSQIEKVTTKLESVLGGNVFYTLNPSDLRQPQQTLKESPFDEKGRNLAAVLRRLLRNNDADWKSLRFALQHAVMGFDTLEIEPVGGYLATKLIYQTDTTEPRTSYIGQESDGTIRMLGLLAALYQDPAQPFLSIEEPEANIHPGALAVLASVLDEASLRSQILVTTHSPDMLDHLPAESFLVVEKVGDTTHVGPLDASQLASVRKRLFTPGELLRMEGLHRQASDAEAAA